MSSIYLIEDSLGTLAIDSSPFVKVGYEIGSRAPREVVRLRALADGAIDDTRYVGGRAVTLTVRLNEATGCDDDGPDMQDLYDMILPYIHPRYRPTLRWTLPRSGSEREMTVRGVSAPVLIEGPKHPVLVVSFVAADGTITSPDEECLTVSPSSDDEPGRSYDLSFDRTYPASLGPGARILTQTGNDYAHWRGTIFGAADTPSFRVNDTEVTFDNNGGLALAAGQWLEIDTKAHTMLLNGVAADSRYDRTNFTEWQWEDLMLKPGENLVRFVADVLGPSGAMQFCWFPTWAG